MKDIRTKERTDGIRTAEKGVFRLGKEAVSRVRDSAPYREGEEDGQPENYAADKAVRTLLAVEKAGTLPQIRSRKTALHIRRDRKKEIRRAARSGKEEIRTPETARMMELRYGNEETVRLRKASAVAKASSVPSAVTGARKKREAWVLLRSALQAAADRRGASVLAGAIALLVICVVSLIGGVAASPFGIFFSIEEEHGSIRDTVSALSLEFYERIRSVTGSGGYDRLEIVSDNGNYGVQWEEILPAYAVLRTTGSGEEVATVTVEDTEFLRGMMDALTSVSAQRTVEEVPRPANTEETGDEENGDGQDEESGTVTVTTLTVTVRHGDIRQYLDRIGFTDAQYRILEELRDEKYRSFWSRAAGGYSPGGQILSPFGGTGAGILSWPLPVQGTVTSGFGYRSDPFTGELRFHGGMDIAAAAGTPGLAAADGTVSFANGTDPWGGGYGYYVILDHGGGMETLYGHCSSVCVLSGTPVRRGEVIAYVGTTGNSTGNHLHFEVRIGGQKTDPMACLG